MYDVQVTVPVPQSSPEIQSSLTAIRNGEEACLWQSEQLPSGLQFVSKAVLPPQGVVETS